MDTRIISIFVEPDQFSVRETVSSIARDAAVHIEGVDVVAVDGGTAAESFSHELVGRKFCREGDVVVAIKNAFGEHTYHNGDIGLVLSGSDGLMVDLGENVVPLTKDFRSARVLSYHKIQGRAFRSVVAVASMATGPAQLRVSAASAKSHLKLVGTIEHLERMVGPLSGGAPDPEELARRLSVEDAVLWDVHVGGRFRFRTASSPIGI